MWITVAPAQPFCARVFAECNSLREHSEQIHPIHRHVKPNYPIGRETGVHESVVEYLKRTDLERNEMRYMSVIVAPGYRVCWFRQKPAAVNFGSEITAMAI